VRIFNGASGQPLPGVLGSFVAYPGTVRGGVRVSVGDVNGDGSPDVITAPGAGIAAQLKVFSGRAGLGATTPVLLRQFLAYPGTMNKGAFLSAGDVDGDGFADIITGTGAGVAGEVRVFGKSNVPLRSFKPYGTFTGGLRVGVGDLNGDGRLDLIVGTGSGQPARVRFFDTITLAEMFGTGGLTPFDTFSGGLFAEGVRRRA
jgi:hypothetical protein